MSWVAQAILRRYDRALRHREASDFMASSRSGSVAVELVQIDGSETIGWHVAAGCGLTLVALKGQKKPPSMARSERPAEGMRRDLAKECREAWPEGRDAEKRGLGEADRLSSCGAAP